MKRMLAGLGILVILASLIMGGVVLAQGQDPYGGGVQKVQVKRPATVQDFLNRNTEDGRFIGPWKVTYTPSSKAVSLTVEAEYVTVLNTGTIIIPLSNGKFVYANNWSLEAK